MLQSPDRFDLLRMMIPQRLLCMKEIINLTGGHDLAVEASHGKLDARDLRPFIGLL